MLLWLSVMMKGMVKSNKIGQSAAKFLILKLIKKKVHRLSRNGVHNHGSKYFMIHGNGGNFFIIFVCNNKSKNIIWTKKKSMCFTH